jgi:hypothetical protein
MKVQWQVTRQMAMPGASFVSFGPTDLRLALKHAPNFPSAWSKIALPRSTGSSQGQGFRWVLLRPSTPKSANAMPRWSDCLHGSAVGLNGGPATPSRQAKPAQGIPCPFAAVQSAYQS